MATTADPLAALERALTEAQEALRAIRAADQVADRRPRYALTRRGTRYVITWEGEAGVFPDCRGFAYISALLTTPGQPWPVAALIHHVTGNPGTLAPSAGFDALDPQAFDAIRRRYRELQAAIYDPATPEEEAEALKEERRQLAAYVGTVSADKPKQCNDRERQRLIIAKAIGRAMAILAEVHPGAADHLRQTITGGAAYCYCGRLFCPSV